MSGRTRAGGSVVGRAGRGLLITALALGVGCIIALSPDIAVPVGVLLLPGLVTLLIDSSPGLGLARAMLLFQTAAGIKGVSTAWYQCAGIHGCLDDLCQPSTVARVWLAAGVAWALAQILPLALKLFEDYRLREKRALLQTRRTDLIAEWGLDAVTEA